MTAMEGGANQIRRGRERWALYATHGGMAAIISPRYKLAEMEKEILHVAFFNKADKELKH